MQYRMRTFARTLIGIAAGTLAAIAFLKFGDAQEPAVQPSTLYRLGNPVWTAGIAWWGGTGFIIGFVGALAAIRTQHRAPQIAFAAIPFAVIISAAILTFPVFAPGTLNIRDYLTLFSINALFLFASAVVPAIFGALFGMFLFAGSARKRSTAEIMPRELKEEISRREHPEREPTQV